MSKTEAPYLVPRQSTEMHHTEECSRYQVKIANAQANYDARFPNYCRKCYGAGLFQFYGDFYEPPSEDPCSACYGNLICPRCGVTGWLTPEEDEVGVPCWNCGWSWRNLTDPYQMRSDFDVCGCNFE